MRGPCKRVHNKQMDHVREKSKGRRGYLAWAPASQPKKQQIRQAHSPHRRLMLSCPFFLFVRWCQLYLHMQQSGLPVFCFGSSRLVGRRVSFAFAPSLPNLTHHKRRHTPFALSFAKYVHPRGKRRKRRRPPWQGRPRLVPPFSSSSLSPSHPPALPCFRSRVSLPPHIPSSAESGAKILSFVLVSRETETRFVSLSPYMYITPYPLFAL